MARHRLITKTLPNGLRIAAVPDAGASTVTALVLVHTGSSFESPKESGLAHFLEHMCFKGTEKRPTPKVLLEEIESLGAVTNAFTAQEYTGYWIKGSPTHVDAFIDILSDIYQHSTLPDLEIAKEKGVVIEEMNMYEDMPQSKVGDVLFEILFDGHAMARSILGSKETVSAFTREDLRSYKARHYSASNTMIILAGNVSVPKATSLIRTQFGTLKKTKKNSRARVVSRQKAPMVRLFSKKTDQAHFALAFRSMPLGHKDAAALRVLSTILGRGMSSRLALLVRDELGAAYYVSAGQESFTDAGIFGIYAGIDKTRLQEVLGRVVGTCADLTRESVSDKELAKAKEFSIGTLRLGLELSDDVAGFYGVQMILGQKVKSPEQVIAEIKKVTTKDILRLAKALFRSDRANLAVVGPFEEKDVSTDILKAL